MRPDEKLGLARKFLSLLSAHDEDVVRSVAARGTAWSFPGSSVISGEAHGVTGRPSVIAANNIHVVIRRAVYGYYGVAIFLHNTGAKSGRVLDEHLGLFSPFEAAR